MKIPLLIAGHSHGGAMGVPFHAPHGPPEICEIASGETTLSALAGPPVRGDDYWDALVAAAAEHVPAISWNGNQHYGCFMFAPEEPFDFVLSSAPTRKTERGVAIVPEAMVRAFFQHSLDELDVLLGRIRASRYRPIVLGTPPPKGDPEELRERFRYEPHFTEWAKSLGQDTDTIALTPIHLIVKLWTLIQDMMAETAARHGALFFPVPDWARTPRGCLKPRFWGGDATHANAAYGARFVADLVADFQPVEAEAA